MKLLQILLLSLSIALASLSCGNRHSSHETDKQGKEYTSAYVCPMHCEGSGSTEPGKCPVCGMDYVKNETQPAGEHTH